MKAFILLSVILSFSCVVGAKSERIAHPLLVIDNNDIARMQNALRNYPEFTKSVGEMTTSVAAHMSIDMDVPMPVDAGGGYTHEQHKKNYKAIHGAGLLYVLTEDRKYLAYAKKILLAYADLYPTLSEHPKKKEQAPGKLFWQSLNEAVWLVYSIQGYDAIYKDLTKSERKAIEDGVFRPMAKFLSEESPQTFNKIHNHGTWATAAVGMTGYVLGDKEMVEKSLFGLDKSGNAGFLKQLDQLFSPDGYYTEGPYYQRYALMPFILFSKAIDYNEPERKIYEYRERILVKAIYTSIQLSYNGLFFPFNDALKDKGLNTVELILGVSVAYGLTRDPALLSIARDQSSLTVSGDGALIANGLKDKIDTPFPFSSLNLRDGAQGESGTLAILRSDNERGHMALVMKNTAQGMGHGHFDKLNWLLYDNGREVVSDYGAARFLNVEAKYGGHYLPENNSWAKQTIAHNTLVVDESSHFRGKVSEGKKYHPESLIFDVSDKVQIASARMNDAYSGVEFTRTFLLIDDDKSPLVLDVMNVTSNVAHRYDLPLYYQGHMISHNAPVTSFVDTLQPLGKTHGYQHLWLKGKSTSSGLAQTTWLLGNRFYSHSTVMDEDSLMLFVELGANDPHFNLRRENGFIHRIDNQKNYTFVSTFEAHGEYNPDLEYTKESRSQVKNIKHIESEGNSFIRIETHSGRNIGVAISYDANKDSKHSISVDGRRHRWQGFYHLFEDR